MPPPKYKFINILILLLLFCGKQSDSFIVTERNGLKHVQNYRPVYQGIDYITLEPEYSIETITDDYSIYKLRDIEADAEGNLYVLDFSESTVTVFDQEGFYIKTLGGHGQGPRELEYPHKISYGEGQLYISEAYSGIIKIWNTDGEYQKQIRIKPYRYILYLKPFSECFYIYFEKPTDKSNIDVHFLQRISIDSTNKAVFKYDYDNSRQNNITPEYSVDISKDQNIYFPEDPDSYIIIQYNRKGEKQFSFGRKYDRAQFSDEAKEIFNSHAQNYQRHTGRELPELEKYPPFIRKIFLDSRENIWVVTGEFNLDNGNYRFQNTLDIFSNKGIWLYTFKTRNISYKSIIRNDRLYTPTNIDNRTARQYINAFKISYQK